MTPVKPEELSALLDGELDAARAAEVKAQIEHDPALRQEFQALSADDAAWRAAADSAASSSLPLTLPALGDASVHAVAAARGWLPALGIATGILIALRAVLKLAGSDALAFMLPAASLLLLIMLVIRLARLDRHDVVPTASGSGEHAL